MITLQLNEMNDRELIRAISQQRQAYKDSYGAIKQIEEEMDNRYKRDIKMVKDSQGQLTLDKIKGA